MGPERSQDPFSAPALIHAAREAATTVIHDVDPGTPIELPDGSGQAGNPLDITRLHQDTGYTPVHDTAHAAADYIDWFRAGHDRYPAP